MNVRSHRVRADHGARGRIRGILERPAPSVFRIRWRGTDPWELPNQAALIRAVSKVLKEGEECEVMLHLDPRLSRSQSWHIEWLGTPRKIDRATQEEIPLT